MAEIFLHYCQHFLILAIFRGKLGNNVGPNVQISGSTLFHKNSDPSKIFQTMFLFAKVLPLVKISARLDHISWSKGPKTSRCVYLHDMYLQTKNLLKPDIQFFDLTSRNS